jgi:acetyltransferase-like isoleucine patch superfamily enzyme
MEPVLSPASAPSAVRAPHVRGEPAPRRGGPVVLLRFLRAHGMLIDFDHGVVEVERPVRLQGIYKRDVRVGNNVWVGYGACFLRGVTVGDNCVVGTSTVVTKDVPDDAVVAGVPARVLRFRDAPQTLRWA